MPGAGEVAERAGRAAQDPGSEEEMSEGSTRGGVAERLQTMEDAWLHLQACAKDDPGDGSLVRAGLRDIARALGMQVRITAAEAGTGG